MTSGHVDPDSEECADQGSGPLHVSGQLHSCQEPGLCLRVDSSRIRRKEKLFLAILHCYCINLNLKLHLSAKYWSQFLPPFNSLWSRSSNHTLNSLRWLISRLSFRPGLWMTSPALMWRCLREAQSSSSALPRDSQRKFDGTRDFTGIYEPHLLSSTAYLNHIKESRSFSTILR